MDSGDREQLLIARADELQLEYENLVRALDAAYDAVKSINCALTQNRAEARRIFEDRLALASPPSLKRIPTDNVQLIGRMCVEPEHEPVVKERPSLFGTIYSAERRNASAARNNRSAGDAISSSLLYSQHKYHQQQQQQPAAYVGDEHSYAVNDDTSDEAKNEEEAAPVTAQLPSDGRAVMVTAMPQWRALFDSNESSADSRTREEVQFDLSIIKTEWPEEEITPQVSIHESVSDDIVTLRGQKAMTNKSVKSKQICVPPLKSSKRKVPECLTEEELKRKRQQTRDRMRRWREKKRLELANQAISKYKVMVGRKPNAKA